MKSTKILATILSIYIVVLSFVSCSETNESTSDSTSKSTQKTQSQIEECEHSWTTATCTAPKTCKKCSITEGEKGNHRWSEATCVNPSECFYCGEISEEALGHTTTQGECTRCYEYIGTRPSNPHYLSNKSINYDEDGGYFYFLFSFLDENEDEIKAAATVSLRIENSNNETVYSKTHEISENHIGTWHNNFKEWLAASIYIYNEEIDEGTSDSGTLYYKITASNGVWWEKSLNISGDLPVKKVTIKLPSFPQTINDYAYDNTIDSSVKITNITYEVNGDDVYFYFTGEKTYDEEGKKYSQSCKVGWKLYDDEGYIVDSGTFYSPSIAVGEKFKNEKEYAYNVIEPGRTYKLVISNVD